MLQDAHLLAVILPRRALRVVCAQVAAILDLCNIEETVRKHHVVRQQFLRLEATLWMAVALAFARLWTCRRALEIAARILHVLAVVHDLDKVVHIRALLLVRIDSLQLAHHCFLPARLARGVVLRVRGIDAGKVLRVRLAGLELLLQTIRQSHLVGLGVVAVLATAMIVVGIRSLAGVVAKAGAAALASWVVPARSLLLDSAVTAVVQVVADVNAAAKVLELLHMAAHVLLVARGRVLGALVHIAAARLLFNWATLAAIIACDNTPRACRAALAASGVAR